MRCMVLRPLRGRSQPRRLGSGYRVRGGPSISNGMPCFCSRCRAARGCDRGGRHSDAVLAKPVRAVYREVCGAWFYGPCGADRSLAGSAAATGFGVAQAFRMACPASVAAAEQREAAYEVGGIPTQSSPNLSARVTGKYTVCGLRPLRCRSQPRGLGSGYRGLSNCNADLLPIHRHQHFDHLAGRW